MNPESHEIRKDRPKVSYWRVSGLDYIWILGKSLPYRILKVIVITGS